MDTNIWRDFLEARVDNLRPLGEFAFQFLKRAIACKHTILYSDLVLEELKSDYTAQEIELYCFESLDEVKLLEKAPITSQQVEEAGRIARERHIPRGDALHCILSRDNNAVVVTRDNHFESLTDIVKSKRPEEVT